MEANEQPASAPPSNPHWNKPVPRVTVEVMAKVCHEANRAFCQTIGDSSQVSWEEAPAWQRESMIRGVEFTLANPDAEDRAQHDAWMAAKLADGWVWGEVKDAEKKTHPCLVNYASLPIDQMRKDALFRGIVGALKKRPFTGSMTINEVIADLDEARSFPYRNSSCEKMGEKYKNLIPAKGAFTFEASEKWRNGGGKIELGGLYACCTGQHPDDTHSSVMKIIGNVIEDNSSWWVARIVACEFKQATGESRWFAPGSIVADALVPVPEPTVVVEEERIPAST